MRHHTVSRFQFPIFNHLYGALADILARNFDPHSRHFVSIFQYSQHLELGYCIFSQQNAEQMEIGLLFKFQLCQDHIPKSQIV